MKIRTLRAQMWLPLPIEQVFAFFSDAGNLDALTPAALHFQILTPRPITLYAGARIDYRLRVHHVPIRWQSMITVWSPPLQFIDEQSRGPTYKIWKHRHDFEAQDGGTWVHDHVEFWPRGLAVRAAHQPLVRVEPDLRAIFVYRQAKISVNC